MVPWSCGPAVPGPVVPENGSVLLVIMATVVILGIALTAVLSLTTHESRVLARTSAWNAALPVAEAGIEEAMSHLRNVDGGPRGINGWQPSGSNLVSYVLTRNLSGSRYTAGISSKTPPVIVSAGQVWCPSANQYIERRIEVKTQGRTVFAKGLVANEQIKMSGQVLIDSFDSLDPNYSTNGMYHPSKRKDKGDVATNLSSPDAMDLSGQVKIYGHLATGPAGTIKNSGAVAGSTNWVDGGNSGIQPGWYAKDMNVSFPAVTAPYAVGSTPLGGTIGGVGYKYILFDGVNYRLSTLNLSGSDKVLVMGNARLLVDKDISISGGGFIQIAANASLQLYVKEGSVSLSADAVINKAGNAANLSLFGLPTLQNINLSGDGSILGTIYAPQAELSMSGGSTTGIDFTGAAVVKSVNASGTYSFHYDESLAYNTARNLVIVSWKEI